MSRYELASLSWGDEEKRAIQKVMDSNMYTMGNYVKSFEDEFAKYTQNKYCIMVNSGSSANLLAIAALFYRKQNPLKKGDEIIVPAVSWPTTYYPLYQYGLKLKFVDIDINTLNFDLKELEKAISAKTKAIFAVNLLGNPNNFNKINNLIKDKNIILLEDNCESLGAKYNGKQTGSFGLLGTYSTFFSHHMATMEGGLIGTDDEELYHIMLSMRSHGWTRHLPEENFVTGIKSNNAFEESFKFVLPGYNIRPIEMMGAIGLEQLKKLPDFIEKRRENAKYFLEIFKNDKRFIMQKEIGESSWFGFSIIISPDVKINRADIIKKLTEADIDTRPIVAGNFTKNEVVKYFDYEIEGSLKNAEYIDKNGFFVGNHQFDIKDKIDYLKNTLNTKF